MDPTSHLCIIHYHYSPDPVTLQCVLNSRAKMKWRRGEVGKLTSGKMALYLFLKVSSALSLSPHKAQSDYSISMTVLVGGWRWLGWGVAGLCASMCACAHVRVHTCVCERLRSEQSSWTVLENWLHSLMVDFCAEWELKTNQLKCQCWSQPSGQLQTLTALTQCVPHTYFIIALPVKLMNPPALSKPAAPKPSWLICVASRRETWPVKILIITTSWKACALLFYLFIPLIIRGRSLLSVTFNCAHWKLSWFFNKNLLRNVVRNHLSPSLGRNWIPKKQK